MRLRKYNKSLGWMSLIAGTVLLSGCDSALLDPKGQIGLEQRSLILTAFGLMMIVVIPAVLMAVGFAWKYRASNKDAYIVTQSIKKLKKEEKEWAPKMLDSGSTKKNRKNPNDPARFIGKIAVTKDGEAADIKQYLDEDKIADDLHETCGFMTDYQFITKSKMRTIQNKSKGKE